MKFKIEIDCDGAAFDDDPSRELARILTKFAAANGSIMRTNDLKYERYPLRDINGNTVGRAWLESE